MENHGIFLFQAGVGGGYVIDKDGVVTISAILVPEKGVVANGAASATFSLHGHKVLSGSDDVVVNPTLVPEASTLEEILLGFGVLGLVAAGSKFRRFAIL